MISRMSRSAASTVIKRPKFNSQARTLSALHTASTSPHHPMVALRSEHQQLITRLQHAHNMVPLYTKPQHRETWALQQLESYHQDIAELTAQIKFLEQPLINHFKNRYHGKTVKDEEELIARIETLEKEKENTDDLTEQFFLDTEISAIQRILNPHVSMMVIGARSWVAERLVEIAKELKIPYKILYKEIDEHTPAIQNTRKEDRLLVTEYTNKSEIMALLLEQKKNGESVGFMPGIGFLSEDSDFKRLCEDNGILFMGSPSPIFSNKALAKKFASEEAGNPIPGSYHETEQGLDLFLREANKIGYPVAIKVNVGGGGGKLNRFAHNDEELRQYYALLSKLGSLTLEKIILNSAHIETNVMGCEDGSVITIDPRNSSIQNTHQKFLECRASFLPQGYVKNFCKAAEKKNFRGSGTPEYLFNGVEWVFLEINPRVQAEHPVTHEATGVDPLKWHIRIFVGRCSHLYLDRNPFLKGKKTDGLSLEEKMDLIRKESKGIYSRQMRLLPVKEILKGTPRKDSIFSVPASGEVTKVKIPPKSKIGKVMLSLIAKHGKNPGTQLDYLKHLADLQVGYAVASGMSQLEADRNVVFLASQTILEVDNVKADQHMRYAANLLLWLHETGGPELTTSAERFNREVYNPGKAEGYRSYEEILKRFDALIAQEKNEKSERAEFARLAMR